ncbi:uncharacterized protein LOC106053383 [Biomphalaria glabrata]|uniref:Uncharacterized protein LOC106053383 n=1 Tax=Biomphalaria glabrata TaxID=6526 RepID=A0A9W3ARF7_BIOGL|nr:uncharacterized protein LOC106053383 [Biomphalaria glabrata]XP_055889801.1 uncharacterized protein LOC106053383 [Biomphalaria glabrata]
MLINTTSSFGQKVKFSKSPILNLEIDLEMDEASNNTISLFTCVIGKTLSSNKLVILEKQVSVDKKESTNDDDVNNNDSSQGKDKVEGLQGTHLLIAVCGTGIVLIVIVAVPVGVWRKRKALPVSVNSVFFLPRCASESWPYHTEFQPDIYAFEPGIQFYFTDSVPNLECSSIQTD